MSGFEIRWSLHRVQPPPIRPGNAPRSAREPVALRELPLPSPSLCPSQDRSRGSPRRKHGPPFEVRSRVQMLPDLELHRNFGRESPGFPWSPPLPGNHPRGGESPISLQRLRRPLGPGKSGGHPPPSSLRTRPRESLPNSRIWNLGSYLRQVTNPNRQMPRSPRGPSLPLRSNPKFSPMYWLHLTAPRWERPRKARFLRGGGSSSIHPPSARNLYPLNPPSYFVVPGRPRCR